MNGGVACDIPPASASFKRCRVNNQTKFHAVASQPRYPALYPTCLRVPATTLI